MQNRWPDITCFQNQWPSTGTSQRYKKLQTVWNPYNTHLCSINRISQICSPGFPATSCSTGLFLLVQLGWKPSLHQQRTAVASPVTRQVVIARETYRIQRCSWHPGHSSRLLGHSRHGSHWSCTAEVHTPIPLWKHLTAWRTGRMPWTETWKRTC